MYIYLHERTLGFFYVCAFVWWGFGCLWGGVFLVFFGGGVVLGFGVFLTPTCFTLSVFETVQVGFG